MKRISQKKTPSIIDANSPRSWFFIIAYVGLAIASTPCGWTDKPSGAQTPGFVESKPTDGIAVQVDGGWMIPYHQRIPGTDVRFEMVPVPAGSFLMGSPDDENGRKLDEGPQVEISVDPMWVGKFEVTNQEYRQFCQLYTVFREIERTNPEFKRVNRKHPDVVTAPTEIYDPVHIYEYSPGPSHPAVAMTRYSAQQYTKWLSAITKLQYRLPTEAEWEYACRGGSKGAFSWGDDPKQADRYCWFEDNQVVDEANNLLLAKAGQKQPNRFGLHDMHGNVAEWTMGLHFNDGHQWLIDAQRKSSERLRAVECVRWALEMHPYIARGGISDGPLAQQRCATRLPSNERSWKDEDPNVPLSPWWYSSDPARMVGFRVFRSFDRLPDLEVSNFWNHTDKEVEYAIESKLLEGRGAIGIVGEKLRRQFKRRIPLE